MQITRCSEISSHGNPRKRVWQDLRHLRKSELTAEAFENDNAKDMNDDNGSASAIVPIHVMNTRGYRLPKTGDAGTTLLAAGGITLAVLSAAAVILLLVFKKKISLTIKKA